MKAMVLESLGGRISEKDVLRLVERPDLEPGPGEILLRVRACGVCHTELDEIEGRTPPPELPVVPGHQAVGEVAARGEQADRFATGDRVGVAWIYRACGECDFCRRGRENLCPYFVATGRDVDGGYAERMTVPEAFAQPLPPELGDTTIAPLLCAGAIGWRSLRLTEIEDGQRLGLTGFGASGHLVIQMARYRFPGSPVFVFARSSKQRAQAEELGATWTGDTEERAPEPLDAIIDTTPAWKPVVEALANLRPGGRLVVNAIRKEAGDRKELQNLDYADHLWMEREVKSVANVTRRDVAELLEMAPEIPLRPEVEIFPLEEANRALRRIREGGGRGAKVLLMG